MNESPFPRRRVNYRFVLVLLGCLLGLGGSVYAVHGLQVRRNARAVYDQAEQARREGHADQEEEYLEQYLSLAPDQTDARARFGALLRQRAKTPAARLKAFLVLEQVLRRDARHTDSRRLAAQLACDLGRFRDAQAHLDVLLQDSPADAGLLQLRGRCEAKDFHFEKAAVSFAKAFTLAPRQADLAEEYAALLRGPLKRAVLADGVIEQLVKADGRALPARLAAARYYKATGQVGEAEKHVRFALDELKAEDAELFLLAAELDQARGKGEEVRRSLERGLKRHPNDPRLRNGLARLELLAGRRQKALEYLEPNLKALPEQPEPLWLMALLLIEAGEGDRAAAALRRLREGGAGAAERLLRARQSMLKGAWGEARTTLEQVRSRLELPGLAPHADLWLAECYEHLGNPDQGLRACRRALEGDPQWLPARRRQAAALAVLGKIDEAITEYRKLAAEVPELRRELARLLLTRSQFRPADEPACAEADKLLADLPDDKRGGDLVLLRAQVLLARQKPEEARKLMEAERDRDPGQVGPWLFLAGLAERQGRAEAILPLLAEAERRAGRRVEWQLARARYWALSAKAEAGKQLQALSTSLGQFPDAERDLLLSGLAGAFALVGDLPAAERLWRQLAGRQPSNLGVRFLLLEVALQNGKDSDVERLVREIRQIEGEGGPVASFGEAARRVLAARGDKGKLAEARQLLARAAALAPSWSRVRVLEAETYELEGQKEKALEAYQAALDLGENRLEVVRRVLELLYEQARYAEADRLLRKLPEVALEAPDLGRLAFQLTLAGHGGGQGLAEARGRALELARRAAANHPDDYRHHLWLAQLAVLEQRPEEAEAAFRKACRTAGKAPDPWVALLLFLARTDPKKAEAELAAAKAQWPGDQFASVAATCYEVMRRTDEAAAQHQAALAARPNHPAVLGNAAGFYLRAGQPAKAEALLNRVLDPSTKAPEPAARAARRALACLLALEGTYKHFQDALTLLEQNGKANGPAVEDQELRALLLATRPAHRPEALRLLEDLPARRLSLAPDVQLLRAQLYEADGNRAKARAALLTLVTHYEHNPRYLAAYVRCLLRDQDAGEARRWVAKLAQVGGRFFETVELRARVLHANGDSGGAVALLQNYAGEKDARLDWAAQILDELGQAQEAEKLYRRHVAAAKDPAGVLKLALHLADRRRVAEALDLCEGAWATCPPEEVAVTSVTALRAGAGDGPQQARVQRRLEAALARAPRSSRLLTSMAELQFLRGNFEEAVARYRQLLQTDGQDVVALNNLAYLLALHEGKTAEALRLIDLAIKTAGPSAVLLDSRAVIRLKGGQADAALDDLNRAILQAPSPTKYFHLAQAHRLKNDRAAARQALAKAQKLGLKPADLLAPEQAALQALTTELSAGGNER
jgi:tetratricopeptide (TPR) repeat protein